MSYYIKIIALLLLSTLSVKIQADALSDALDLAQNALDIYKESAPVSDYQHLIDYLPYYRSWYQAVTPAPVTLIQQLSMQALTYVNTLKTIAKNAGFVTSKPSVFSHQLIGSSLLKPIGDQFYQAVITLTDQQLQRNLTQQGSYRNQGGGLAPLEPVKAKLF